MPSDYLGLSLYLFLFPGILGYLVYGTIAESTLQTETFEKIVMAMSLTLLSALISGYIFRIPFLPEFRSSEFEANPTLISTFISNHLWVTSIIACALGVTLAWLRNTGWIFYLLRKTGVTKRTGRIDPWHQIFVTYQERWVQLRFSDGSLLVGWPKYYSEEGSRKELFLMEACWHFMQKDGSLKKQEINGPGVFVTNFDKVIGIEFLTE